MSIPAEKLRPGQQIFVTGQLTFGKLSRQYTGEELARRVEQQKRIGALYPTTTPHTTVNIADAVVTPRDPQNPTLEEQFVQSKIYTIKSGENQGKAGFGIDDKGQFLPIISEKTEAGTYRQVKIDRELASGLNVTLVLETYDPKGYAKKGLGLSQVLVNEPIRYYGGGASAEALADRGIVFEGEVERVSVADAPAEAPAAEGGGYQAPEAELPANSTVDPNSGLAMPSPGPAQPAAAPAAQAPVQTPAPAPAAPAAEDKDAEIARLKAQLAGGAASATPQGQSAFDADTQAQPSPWDPA